MIRGMDYILANLVPSEDTVSVPLSVPLGDTVPEQPEDDDEYIENGEDDKEPTELSSDEAAKRRKRMYDLQSFNSYMRFMKRADRQLYDDIKKRFSS
jgi:hypothetical protein